MFDIIHNHGACPLFMPCVPVEATCQEGLGMNTSAGVLSATAGLLLGKQSCRGGHESPGFEYLGRRQSGLHSNRPVSQDGIGAGGQTDPVGGGVGEEP